MGIMLSNDSKTINKTNNQNEETQKWFNATLIDFECFSINEKDTEVWKHYLNKKFSHDFKNILKNPGKFIKKNKKFDGKIGINKNCIIFQELKISDYLNKAHSIEKSIYLLIAGKTANSITLPKFVWPIHTIRHFGYQDQVFTFDTGRMSPTGSCRFTFKIKHLNSFLMQFQDQYSTNLVNINSSIPLLAKPTSGNSSRTQYIDSSEQQHHQYANIRNCPSTSLPHLAINNLPVHNPSSDTKQFNKTKTDCQSSTALTPVSLSVETSSSVPSSPVLCYTYLDFPHTATDDLQVHDSSSIINKPHGIHLVHKSNCESSNNNPSTNNNSSNDNSPSYVTINEYQTKAVEYFMKTRIAK